MNLCKFYICSLKLLFNKKNLYRKSKFKKCYRIQLFFLFIDLFIHLKHFPFKFIYLVIKEKGKRKPVLALISM